MLEDLKYEVYEANLALWRSGLVMQTFGNVSGVDREAGQMVIKPSGVPYEQMTPEDMVAVCLETGEVLDGTLRPSSDTPTHRELYLAFEAIGGVVHSHSAAATAWAQAGRDLPALGTTHADYFHGPVPCTRMIRAEEISAGYETATGQVIAERFAAGKIDPVAVPAVLVAGHGPFAWGDNADDAVHHAEVLEYVSDLAIRTLAIQSSPPPFPQTLLDKHFLRKHGPGAYYGQESGD